MGSFKIKDDITPRSMLIRIAIVVVTIALIVLAMPVDTVGAFYYETGKPWRYGDLTALFDFPIHKDETTVAAERDSVTRRFERYYNYNADEEGRQVRAFVSEFAEGIPGVPDDYISVIANRLRRVYQTGIISSADYAEIGSDTMRAVRIIVGKKATSVLVKDLYSEKGAYEQLFADETLSEHRTELQKCDLSRFITPNLTYDKERSDIALNDLLETIPLTSGMVQKGQKIISQGDIVTEEIYRTLASYEKENAKHNQDTAQKRLTTCGHILYVTVFLVCFTVYLSLFRKDYFDKYHNTAMLYTLIIIFVLLTSLIARGNFTHVYIMPYAMVPIFVRVFMDSRTAFITHFTMVMICACMVQNQLEFVALLTLTGLAAIYSLRELQKRSQLFKTAFIVCLVGMAVIGAFDLIRASSSEDFDNTPYVYFGVSCLLLLPVYPMLYIFEKTFGFISDITLIELSNNSNTLLRRLSEVANGTFQHSITVGNIAAAVADKIGAKSELVRTGALYHDIGKITNPIYFTENQAGVNPHLNLTEIESAQIIISHVTEGLKIAEKDNLPDVIKDFISTHHGLGKTKFFYRKYISAHPDENVDELLFTYPGPNPFTREQAILMMADTVEAASRSLNEKSERAIREMVDRLVDGMVDDGFFRECPITFRDIAYAKTVMTDKLKSIYHTRIAYPEESASRSKANGEPPGTAQ